MPVQIQRTGQYLQPQAYQQKEYIPDFMSNDQQLRVSKPKPVRSKLVRNLRLYQEQTFANATDDVKNKTVPLLIDFLNPDKKSLIFEAITQMQNDLNNRGVYIYFTPYTQSTRQNAPYKDIQNWFGGGFKLYSAATSKTYPIGMLTKYRFWKAHGVSDADLKNGQVPWINLKSMRTDSTNKVLAALQWMKAMNRLMSTTNGLLRRSHKDWDYTKMMQDRDANRLNTKFNSKLKKLARYRGFLSAYDYLKGKNKDEILNDLISYEQEVAVKMNNINSRRLEKMDQAGIDFTEMLGNINENTQGVKYVSRNTQAALGAQRRAAQQAQNQGIVVKVEEENKNQNISPLNQQTKDQQSKGIVQNQQFVRNLSISQTIETPIENTPVTTMVSEIEQKQGGTSG